MIQNLNIEGVKEEFFSNIESRSVASYKWFEHKGEIYYKLKQIPSSLYNVEYKNTVGGIFYTNQKRSDFKKEHTSIYKESKIINFFTISYF